MVRSTPEQLREIKDLCIKWAPMLHMNTAGGEPDGAALLYTLFLNERYTVHNTKPRFEPAYYLGGKYCRPGSTQARLCGVFGEDAAKSFSNFQILFPVAAELGYLGTPRELDYDSIAIQFVVRLIARRILPSARKHDTVVATLSEILDAYNSGNCVDVCVPSGYIERGCEHYAQAIIDLQEASA